MARVLITAFEPYDRWKANASWLALVELTKTLPPEPQVTTRLYPVDFSEVRRRLEKDLEAEFDFALHVGQAPGSAAVQLEAVGINVGGSSQQHPDEYKPLVENGPVAYRSALPLSEWAGKLREAGIPAQVSYHAGTFLCNATLYLTHDIIGRQKLPTRATFIHLPLSPQQVLDEHRPAPSLSEATSAEALRLVLEQMAEKV